MSNLKNYVYITKKSELNKINEQKNDYKLLPYIISNEIENKDLINKNMFICFKSPNRIYCEVKVLNIINKDNSIYKTMVNKLNLTDTDQLYFIKFELIKIINLCLMELNNFLKINDNNFTNIIYPYNMSIFNINYFKKNNIDKLIENYILEKKNNEIEDNDVEDNKINKKEKVKINKKIILDIPINWICCNELLIDIKKNNVNRNLLKSHYLYCSECIKTNNNNSEINWDKKQLILKKIKNKNKMNNVIESYLKLEKLGIEDEEFIDQNKINLFYYKNDDEIYNNTIMIINKN